MCHRCVTDVVKRRMLLAPDRSGAGPAAVPDPRIPAALAALSRGVHRVMDLTHVLDADFPTWEGRPGIAIEQAADFARDGFNDFTLRIAEHTGTHFDAPLHYSADGHAVHEVPVESLVAPIAVVDIRAKADTRAEAQVTPDDLRRWRDEHGEIPEGAVVAMLSGWERHLGTPTFRGADEAGVQHYPAFHAEAARMLLEETSAVGIAVDTLSLDIGSSETFDTHHAWLPANRWGLEAVANLARLPASGATMVVGAPKHRGGSGGPARVIALV